MNFGDSRHNLEMSPFQALGRKHKLTSYDAAYLELAMRRGVAPATLDKNLRKAAMMEGVPVLPGRPFKAT